MARLVEAHREGLEYLLIYEDDAFPCADAQGELDRLQEEHPLPADCGILALGDINGVSRYRGVQTLLLPDCAEVYTRLEPIPVLNKFQTTGGGQKISGCENRTRKRRLHMV